MSKSKSPATTRVVGYYNPNPWRVHVAISELNLSVTLEPQQFILERQSGKKFNDPLLQRYVGPKMLEAEVGKAQVPVLHLPTIQSSGLS